MSKRFTDEVESYTLRQELRTGKYYPPLSPFLRRDTVSTIAANRLYACPHVITRKSTIDRIAFHVNIEVAGSHCRLGLYDSDNVHPRNLLLDAGVVDTDTTGFKAVVIDRQLNPGLYWFVVVSDDTPNLYVLKDTYEQGSVVMGNENEHMYYSPVGVYVSHTYGALPNPFGTPTEWRNYAINVLYRLASLD